MKNKAEEFHRKLCKLSGVVVFLAAVVFLIITISQKGFSVENKISDREFGNNMELELEDGTKRHVKLPLSIQVDSNETFRLSKIIPRRNEESLAITFLCRFQNVAVFVDDEMIYQNIGYTTKKNQNTPANEHVIIDISAYKGKKITIEVKSPYQSYSGKFNQIYIGSEKDVVEYINTKYLKNYVLDYCLLFFGIVVFAVSFLLKKNKILFKRCFYLGLSGISIAVWLRIGTNNVPIISINAYMVLILSFIFFYAMCNFLLEFFRYYFNLDMFIIDICQIVLLIYEMVSFGLQLFGIMDLIEMIKGFHALIVLTLVVIFFLLISSKKEEHNKQELALRILILTLICGGSFVELVSFYSSKFDSLGTGFRTGIVLSFLVLSIEIILRVISERNQYELQVVKLKEEKTEFMISQLQPHFLFNALGAIRILTQTNPQNAYNAIYYFSKYLRRCINGVKAEEKILFRDELEHVKAYLEIEKLRFQDSFHVNFDINEQDFYVVPSSVLAIVQNAVSHGIRRVEREGLIHISTRQEGSDIVILVKDNGKGYNALSYHSKSDGMQEFLSLDRIKKQTEIVLQGDIHVDSVLDLGTTVEIRIPQKSK